MALGDPEGTAATLPRPLSAQWGRGKGAAVLPPTWMPYQQRGCRGSGARAAGLLLACGRSCSDSGSGMGWLRAFRGASGADQDEGVRGCMRGGYRGLGRQRKAKAASHGLTA